MLYFLKQVAQKQVGQGGEAVKTSQILHIFHSYSRTTVHKWINEAIKANTLKRVKRGYYIISPTNSGLIAIGLCVLLPMDVFEYQSKKELLKHMEENNVS